MVKKNSDNLGGKSDGFIIISKTKLIRVIRYNTIITIITTTTNYSFGSNTYTLVTYLR